MKPFEAPEYAKGRAALEAMGVRPCRGSAPIEGSIEAILEAVRDNATRRFQPSSSSRVLLLERAMLINRLEETEAQLAEWVVSASVANQRVWELEQQLAKQRP